MINGKLSWNGSVSSNGYSIRIRCSFAKFASTRKRPTYIYIYIHLQVENPQRSPKRTILPNMNPLRTTGTRTFLNATMIFISISPEIV
jgi:hypothetical protein